MPSLTRPVLPAVVLTVATALAVGVTPAAAGAPPLTGATNLAAHSQTSCTVTTTHNVRCWGRGDEGQIGNGGLSNEFRARIVHNPDGNGALGDAVQVSAGDHHVCARLSSGQARCWGNNASGQIGDGTQTATTRPVVVSNGIGTGPLTGVAQVSAGANHTCARLNDGRVACWGSNSHGQLGDGTATSKDRPVLVLNPAGNGPLDDVAQVAAGLRHTCARRTGGQVRCWGDNNFGQLGNGSEDDDHLLPVAVVRPNGTGRLSHVAQIASSVVHTCVALTNGQARCWGSGGSGELGSGDESSHTAPVAVDASPTSGAPLTNVVQVATGSEHSCFRIANGRVRCAGMDGSGQIGNPSVGDNAFAPVLVRNGSDTGPLGGVAQIAVGSNHSCARLASGQLRCWGDNIVHQLGDGTSTNRPLPVPVQEG